MKKFFGCAIMALIVLMCGLGGAAQTAMKMIALKITVTDENGNAFDTDKYVINCDLSSATDESGIELTGMEVRNDNSYTIYVRNPENATKVNAMVWMSKAEMTDVNGQDIQKMPVDDVEAKTIEIDLSKAKAGVAPKRSQSKVKYYDADGKELKPKKGTPIVPDELEVKVTLAHTK